MSEDAPALTFDDLQREIEGDLAGAGRARQASLEQFIDRPVPPKRRVLVRGATGGGSLINRCGPWEQKRFASILHFESGFPEDGDYALLIGPACQLFEKVIEKYVVEPACAEAFDQLLASLAVRDSGQKSALEQWRAKGLPITLGTACLVLLALRRGCELPDRPLESFLAEHFRPNYPNVLRTQKPDARLNVIRDRYRNKIMHGAEVTYGTADYEQFVRLVVAHRRFGDWDKFGPEFPLPNPRAGDGLLHQHLSLLITSTSEPGKTDT